MKLRVTEAPDCYFLGGHGFLSQSVVNSHASDHLDILADLDFLKGFMATHTHQTTLIFYQILIF